MGQNFGRPGTLKALQEACLDSAAETKTVGRSAAAGAAGGKADSSRLEILSLSGMMVQLITFLLGLGVRCFVCYASWKTRSE